MNTAKDGGSTGSHRGIMEEYKIEDNITEALKEQNEMEWLRKMNAISNIVDEIVRKEYVYNDEIL